MFLDYWKSVTKYSLRNKLGIIQDEEGGSLPLMPFPLICAEPLPGFNFTRFIFIDFQQ